MFQIQQQYLHTWWPLHYTNFRLLVKKSMVEFLSDELESRKGKCFLIKCGFKKLRLSQTTNCVLYLWCEEPLYPTGQERFVQNTVD